MKVAIIGSGWSGLSCAQKLLEIDPSCNISIFESSHIAGGRAKGLEWRLSDGEIAYIDNGQHFLIGAYRNTFSLLKELKLTNWEHTSFSWNYFGYNDENFDERFELDFKNIFTTLFINKKSWPILWYFSIIYAVLLSKLEKKTAKGSSREWLSRSKQPRKLQEVFWRPFIESTTNTCWDEASAFALVTILNECTKNFPKSIEIFHPKRNLSKDGTDLLIKKLKEQKVNFFFGNTIKLINKDRTIKNNKNCIFGSFDHIVLAVSSFSVKKIWEKSLLDHTSESVRWNKQNFRGINTLWIALPIGFKRNQKHNSENYWEIRQLCNLHGRSIFVVVERPSFNSRFVISIVQSAVDLSNADMQSKNIDKMKLVANDYLKWMFNLSLKDCEHKLLAEKRATFSCTGKLSDSKDLWGNIKTGIPKIWRCSDDCVKGYPATIESAVIAGSKVAEAITSNEVKDIT